LPTRSPFVVPPISQPDLGIIPNKRPVSQKNTHALPY
jgi:hypothetical protein